MKQRILITGGSGLLAVNWALAARDRCLITLGIHKRTVSVSGTRTRSIDLESVDGLFRVFEEESPSVVIHTVGLTSVEKCEAEPEHARHVNVGLASNVAQACARLGIKLVHISSDHLFSGQESLLDEDHPVAPLNVYGKTKAEAESRVLDCHPQALVIRTNFYAWGTSYRHSFSDFVIESLRGGKNLTLFQDVFYSPILAEAAIQAIHDLIDLKAIGVFNAVSDERISKYDFGRMVTEQFGLPTQGITPGFFADQRAMVQRPYDMSLSNRKICGLLGRPLGGVAGHLGRLSQQEQDGVARELRNL